MLTQKHIHGFPEMTLMSPEIKANFVMALVVPQVDFVISGDYIVVMTKVGIAQLKAHLSHYVRAIRRGETVVVLDRNEPVARIVPFQSQETILPVRGPLQPLREYAPQQPLRPAVDSLPALLEERRDRR